MNHPCPPLTSWLSQVSIDDEGALPPDHVIAHIADCPHCRGSLVTLLADLCGPGPAPTDMPCEAVEHEMPAFIDYEVAHGVAATMQAFPDVWWHSLVCPQCSELYSLLRDLVAQHDAPLLAPVAPARQRLPIRARLEVYADLILQFLHADQQLGVAWGQEASDMVIAEEQDEIGMMQLSLRQKQPGGIALIVRIDPPLAGSVALSVAGANYHATLDATGSVVFASLPESLFTTDPDATVSFVIEPT